MKFQSTDRPIPHDSDAILIYTEEQGDSLIVGAINPETGAKEPIFKFSALGRIVMNIKPPSFLKFIDGKPSIDIDILH